MLRVTLARWGVGTARRMWEGPGVNDAGATERALWEEIGNLAGEPGVERRQLAGSKTGTVASGV